MGARVHAGVYDPVKGARDYEGLSPLTAADRAYLDGQPSDKVRRRTLATWYGHHGGAYAWRLYLGLDTGAYRAGVIAPDRGG